jgi:lipid-A-disaccharide synthase
MMKSDIATVMIVSGESSGELYGSLLAKTLKIKRPDVRIIGVGGDRMQMAGVELVSRTSDAFGIVEAISAYKNIKTAFDKTVGAVKKFVPDVLVLIDYPDFNLRVAEVAKSLGIKILYYVSPQVWAWRKGRVKKIAGIVDRMAVILPFEEEIYRKAGVQSEFVGHPILEEIESVLQPEIGKLRLSDSALTITPELRAHFKSILGFNAEKPLLSLLPGSRPSELSRLLPLMTTVVRLFKSRFTDYQFCVPVAPNTDENKYRSYIEALGKDGVSIKKGESVKALAASDMAVVASGTATLQTAFLEVPMVVVYKLSPITYLLGRMILDVKYISLVNILSGREVVKELIQGKADPEGIIKELNRIMTDTAYRKTMLGYYRLIKGPFLNKKASDRVTEIVIEMSGNKEE